MPRASPPPALLTWLPLWIFVAGASIFLHGPLPLFSTRTLTVAWEMWHLGEWLIPHQNGLPYSHKAPLLYWMIHAGWAVGGVSDVWPRILIIALSSANLVLVALLARALFPLRAQAQRLAPWILIGLLYWFLYALQIMFDLLVSACALLALLGLTRRDTHGSFVPRWSLVTLGLALGLLAKGPVALLHLAFPLLFGPWWNDRAAAAPRAWYMGALGSIGVALLVFAIWVVPVSILGGEAYRQELLVQQTAGRVVDAFDHARPLWWYLAAAPILLFPWVLWPATWRGIAQRAQRSDSGLRMLAVWLLPTVLAFSAISGKQAYYLLPQLAGFAVWLAGSITLREHHADRRGSSLLPALALMGLGSVVALLPLLVEHGLARGTFTAIFALGGPHYGLGVALLGLLLALTGGREAARAVPRIAVACLLSAALLHGQFTATVWSRYDLAPAAAILARYAEQGALIANRGRYEGQFNFLARLRHPVVELNYDDGPPWAARHPDAIVVDYVPEDDRRALSPAAPQPLWSAPFRSERMEVWRAGDWLAARSMPSAVVTPRSDR